MNEMETQSQEKINPLLAFWLHPKKATRDVLDNKNLLYVIVFLSLGYIGSAFSGFIDWDIELDFSVWAILFISILLSPILGIISNAFNALGIWLIGKLFKGIATFQESFKAISISVWPFIYLIPIYILWLLIDSDSLFYMSTHFSFFSIIGLLFTAAAIVWSIMISIAAVAEAHQFSNWKSFFTLLIFAIIMGIIFFIIGIIIVFIIFAFGFALYV